MEYVPRDLALTLHRATAAFPVVLVTGARQTGKTTMPRAEFARTHRYLSLERPDVRLRAEGDPAGFLAENAPPVILDEIHYTPSLLPYIKERVDADRRPGACLLTGSQAFGRMKGVSESLAGRAAVLTLDPLAVGEVVGTPPPPSVDDLLARVFGAEPVPGGGTGSGGGAAADVGLADWVLRGGYPEPRLQPDVGTWGRSNGSWRWRPPGRARWSTSRTSAGRWA